MPTARELRAKRRELLQPLEQLRRLANDAKHSWSAENAAAYEKVNQDYDALSRQIDLEERLEQRQKQAREEEARDREFGRDDHGKGGKRGKKKSAAERACIDDKQRCLALQAFFRTAADKPLRRHHVRACKALNFNPRAKKVDLALPRTHELRPLLTQARAVHPTMLNLIFERALSALTVSTGGALVPQSFVRQIERAMLLFGPMLRVGDVIVTSDGREMPWPTVDDTSGEGEMVGENVAVTEGSVAFGKRAMGAYKFSSKMIKIPVELFEDADFDIGAFLGELLGERLERAKNRKFTVGTGASEPYGVVTQAVLGKTSASATAIAAGELIDLQHSVDAAYRANARFMAHDNIIAALRKLVDSQGRYLWESGLNGGQPDRILGNPIETNNHMDSTIAASKNTVLYGDFQKYKIRQVGRVRIRRLSELFAANDQEGMIALERADGMILNAGQAPIKKLQQTT